MGIYKIRGNDRKQLDCVSYVFPTTSSLGRYLGKGLTFAFGAVDELSSESLSLKVVRACLLTLSHIYMLV